MLDYLPNKIESWSNNTKDFFTSLLGIPASVLRDQRFISKGVLMKGFAQLIEELNTYRGIELHILPQIYSSLSALRNNIPINEANELINLWFPQDFPSISPMKYINYLLNNSRSLSTIPIYLNKQKSLSKNTRYILSSIIGLVLDRFMPILETNILIKGFARLRDNITSCIKINMQMPNLRSQIKKIMDMLMGLGSVISIYEFDKIMNICFPFSFGQLKHMDPEYSHHIPRQKCLIINSRNFPQIATVTKVLKHKEYVIGKGTFTDIQIMDINLADEHLQFSYSGRDRENIPMIYCMKNLEILVRISNKQKWMLFLGDEIHLAYSALIFRVIHCISKRRDPQYIRGKINKNGPDDKFHFSSKKVDDWGFYTKDDQDDAPSLKIQFIRTGGNTGDVLVIHSKQVFRIGRANTCEYPLEDVTISNVHAQIEYEEKLGWFISEPKPQGTINGTWLKTSNEGFPILYNPVVLKSKQSDIVTFHILTTL